MVELIYKDIAPGAKDDISAIETSEKNSDISDNQLLVADLFDHKNYATVELNQWKLDGTYSGITTDCVPYWSNQVSADEATDGRYYFASPITLTRVFKNKHTSVGMSFIFDNPDYCNHLNIKWYNDGETVADVDFSPDNSEYYCQCNVELFNKVTITFYSMNKGNRFLKIFTIDDGVNRKFSDSELYSISILEDMSLISEELPINTLSVSLRRGEDTEFIFQKKQPMLAYRNGKLYGTFFVDSSERSSRDVYDVTAQCYKGILDAGKFYGGLYKGVTVKSIVDEIFYGEKFKYTIDDVTANKLLWGYIPICSKREAMAQVLFAACAVCDTARSNTFDIYRLADGTTDIPADRIYFGGKITTSDIVTSVKIQIHKYTKATEKTDVFNGEVASGQSIVEFSAPIDVESATISGATLISCYTNYCVIDAENSGEVVIKAYEYTDNVTTKVMYNENISLGTATNQIEISDATLVSSDNSDEVLANVYNHYMKNRVLETDVVIEGEKCGIDVTLETEWSGKQRGRLEQMEYDLRSKTIGKVVQRIG